MKVATVGIDVGVVTLKIVAADETGRVVVEDARRHLGNAEKSFEEALGRFSLRPPSSLGVGVTGSGAAPLARKLGLDRVDGTAALLAGARGLGLLDGARYVLDLGGGSVSLIELDDEGAFASLAGNSLCAAGTGSFLDEQAARLGLGPDLDGLAGVAFPDDPPIVATRCAVFAKSDLIHHQQQGRGKLELWSGLCRSLARTIITTLFKGARPAGRIVLTGGLVRNSEVLRWLEVELGESMVFAPPAPHLVQAAGAAALGPRDEEGRLARLIEAASRRAAEGRANEAGARPVPDQGASGSNGEEVSRRTLPLRPALLLRRSSYPEMTCQKSYEDALETQVRLVDWPLDPGGRVAAAMGVDVGSTSTKAALVAQDGRVVADFYRRTAGDPVGAARALMRAILDVAREHSTTLEIAACGTTGSGRALVGALLGADAVLNEISAHLDGARSVYPEVETIFEIGGQDAKYIRARAGRLVESNMNYVCAAGTGSFVEEVVRKLGFPLSEVGENLLGVQAPVTSERCTVFMEQDVNWLLREGYSREEALAAVCYSVMANYLAKVVGRRPVSRRKVVFQGATALNKALVAALEGLLDTEVVVSPFCHVLGAVGVARLARAQVERGGRATRFEGFALLEGEVRLEEEKCLLCNNRCRITKAHVPGRAEAPSFGYLCGRDPETRAPASNREGEPVRTVRRLLLEAGGSAALPSETPSRRPVVGIPRSLLAWSYLPMWRGLLGALGCEVRLGRKTDREIVAAGVAETRADCCLPVKLAYGQAAILGTEGERDLDFLFLPHMIGSGDHEGKTTASRFCPYNIAIPSMIREALGRERPAILSPSIDLGWPESRIVEELVKHMAGPLGIARARIAPAWKAALAEQRSYKEACLREGARVLSQCEATGKPAVVLLGRTYNCLDEGANLAIPAKLARLGVPVIPMEMLPLDEVDPGEPFRNMFWGLGRKILEAARFVAARRHLSAVFLTNFSCGPDSFILSYVERVLKDKPLLILELDEHGADGGYLTRLEAFADVLRTHKPPAEAPRPYGPVFPAARFSEMKGRTVWVPPMHRTGSPLIAAAMRSTGVDVQPLPAETPETYAIGRSLTRGTECLPCACTVGPFMHKVQSEPERKHALFMLTAEGPCRFGQYATLDRIILAEAGMADVPVVSWTSADSYGGDEVAADRGFRRRIFNAIALSDVLFKMRCRVAPYEVRRGEADEATAEALDGLGRALEAGRDPGAAMSAAVSRFARIARREVAKPLVGVVGEIYVRFSPFANQDVVRAIEEAGGEAWVAPVAEWILYTAQMEEYKLKKEKGGWLDRIGALAKNRFLETDFRRWEEAASRVVGDRREPPIASTLRHGAAYLPIDFEGEAILTVGRALEFVEQGARLVVNCAPFGCMPGAITSSLFQSIRERGGTDLKVVTIFYDGENDLNGLVRTFLANIEGGRAGGEGRAVAIGGH